MNSKLNALTCIFGVIALMLACRKDKIQPQTLEIQFVVPANFPQPEYAFKENKPTNAGFELGRKLFYDTGLSIDNSISCGSCHQQFAAFANLDHPLSHGVNNCLGKRNAPTLFNMAWQKEFFWDGGAKHIEVSPINALTNGCEMANDLNAIVAYLKKSAAYPLLFKQSFGTDEINSQVFLKALAQFTGLMISANSKYDQIIRKEKGAMFTSDECAGYLIFKQKCASCHAEPLFTDNSYRNNGLNNQFTDTGREHITNQPEDIGKFRVPSLRNVALSRPYMHDGRFCTLDEVLNHYTNGAKLSATLDPELQKQGSMGIVLSITEKKQLIQFLNTLTDTEFIKDKRFSEH